MSLSSTAPISFAARMLDKEGMTLDTQHEARPYEEVHLLMKKLDGTMKWYSGGGPGGFWELHLKGRTARVDVRNHKVNDLDRLYVARVDDPKTWDDYEHPGTLMEDALWRLVDSEFGNGWTPTR